MTRRYAPQEIKQIARKIAERIGKKHWRLRHMEPLGFELWCGDDFAAEWTRCEGRTDVFEMSDQAELWMKDVVLDCQETPVKA